MGKNAIEKLYHYYRGQFPSDPVFFVTVADDLEKAIHDDWHGGTGWTSDCRHCRDEMLWNDEQSD